MTKRNKKQRRFIAMKPEQPWQPLQNAEFTGGPQEHDPRGFVGVFINDLYQVSMYEADNDAEPMAWLVIRRRDSEPIHDWRPLQLIKNQLCGPEREGFELFPAESRLVDTSNQYHIFVLPAGQRMPFGYVERDISDVSCGKNKQRPFVEPPPDLNAKVGGDTPVMEVPVLFPKARKASDSG